MLFVDREYLKPLVLERKEISHKGDYGHLLVVGGCTRMPGAAVLATGAALKSGCGLVTLHSTNVAAQATVSLFPSAMLSVNPGDCFSEQPERLSRYSAIAAGPGLGMSGGTRTAFSCLLKEAKDLGIPMVLDADALNIISSDPALKGFIPVGSVMTPHVGELKRLLPDYREGEDERIISLCSETGCVIVRKGFRSEVFTPDGKGFTNTTGNPGMAKGGSGDVLTGLLGGLLARGYDALSATLMAVWIHGYAGDCLTEECTTEAYNSFDLIGNLYKGFHALV